MSADVDWGLYRTFLAVIEEGSLSGAARRLGLTQPTIARHIDQTASPPFESERKRESQ